MLSVFCYKLILENSKVSALLFLAIVPNILFCEGSIIFVLFGVAIYFIKNNRELFIKIYISFSLVEIGYYKTLNHLCDLDFHQHYSNYSVLFLFLQFAF